MTDEAVPIEVDLNGRRTALDVAPTEAAVEAIRERAGLTGTKYVCGAGVCGTCTVLVDGTPTATCLLPATALDGTSVTTVEGLAAPDLHPVQRAFMAHDALQCGYCTPGFVVDAAAFVDDWRTTHGDTEPDRTAIADALAGHLCRCGAYAGIYRAVAAACRGEFDAADTATSPRVEAAAKVTGAARYTTDITLPGMLHGAIVRARTAAGRVDRLDLTPARGVGGAQAVVDLRPSDPTIRWVGQPLAAVAATDMTTARRAARAVAIEISPAEAVLSVRDAMTDGAPSVYADRAARRDVPNSSEGPLLPVPWHGNHRGPTPISWLGPVADRRIAAARRRGDPLFVSTTYTTAVQVHTSFEPHAAVADWSAGERLRLWVSTQAVEQARREAAAHTGLDPDRVEVIADHVGGGFGSKLSLGVEAIAAIELSRTAAAPVRVVLDRSEELTATGLRPGSRTDVTMLADTDGGLSAMTVDTVNDGGVSVGVLTAALASVVYGRSPRRTRDHDVVTNAPPGSPFRGPGGPPLAWAVEQSVDEVAHRLGEDPLALRRRWNGSGPRGALYERAAGLPMWRDRPWTGSQTGRYRRGVGTAAANWLYFADPSAEVTVRVADGRLVASTAAQDMGTGGRTVVARAVAEVFGVDPADVEVEIGRSGAPAGGTASPHGPTSGGSRTTASLWPAATTAATRLHEQIGGNALALHEGRTVTARRPPDPRFRAVPVPPLGMQVGAGRSNAVHVTEVEVDTRTGRTRALRVWAGIAAGRIHVPELARSQCEGSVIQGIGYALYEQRRLDPHTGVNLTANLEDYRIPQLGDTPEITVHFEERGWEHVPGGGIGLGEVATMGVAASVGNAIHNATGWRPLDLPVTPDRMIAGLRGSGGAP
ncbi:MAG TPA: molybdopterin-dependent oxidoreductase [Euzebyales bacterium]